MWNFKKFSDRTALIQDDGFTMTYGELESAGNELAEAIGKRCLIFSFCLNKAGSVMGYGAFINHGIVPVLLNAHVDAELREGLIETYKPSYLWAPESMRETLGAYRIVYSAYGYDLWNTGYPDVTDIHPDLALLLTTSGSTGSPKFVRQSYQNIRANTESIVEYLELTETERAITTLPMNYTYGLSIIQTHFWVGATMLLTDRTLMDRAFWSFFKEAGATSFAGVPYTYEMLDRLRFNRMDLPTLRYMTQAGGKLTPELHKKFAETAEAKGQKFIVMYGQCEATARMGWLPPQYSVSKFGSMGIPIPGGVFHIIDVNGKLIEEPEVSGELVYEGENVTMGYAECPADLAKGDERHGRLETGDMAKFDADGFYYIVGRKKRFLKMFGNRVNLDEIDRLIKTYFDNKVECASAGVDDHMYVFVTDESVKEEVRRFVAEKTNLNQKAINVLKIDEIPKNDSGKVQYKELAKYYS